MVSVRLDSANTCLNKPFHNFLGISVGFTIVRTEASSYQYNMNIFDCAKKRAVHRVQKIVN